MSRLPPAEKLPLAIRKDWRDEFEAKKADWETKLSELTGVTWTVDISPNAIYPYATEDYPKTALGRCLANYVEGAISQLARFESTHGQEGISELNGICSAHVITMDISETKKFNYCGVIVADGKLVIVFAKDKLGYNANDALQSDYLLEALNSAPPAEGNDSKLSYAARAGIRLQWDAKIEPVKEKLAATLGKDMKLLPNFDDVFAALAQEKKRRGNDLENDWESRIGSTLFQYFEGVADQLKNQKFDDDEMLQEGFNDAVDKGEIAFRIVDKLKYDNYCEVVVEGGVLYIQTIPSKYGKNCWYAAQKVVDQL